MRGEVIFKGVFGSHLYGLETNNSDLDMKGVYCPKLEDIIFNNYKETIEETSKEVDTSFYAVTKFVNILNKSDTISMDMLHTPKEMTLSSSPLWRELVSHRKDLYAKSMRGILGYIRTQASKYGHKVQRYNELVKINNYLSMVPNHFRLSDTGIPFLVKDGVWKYISFNEEKGDVKENIDILGSRYQTNATVEYVRDQVRRKLTSYGDRTKKGSMTHGDWKSMSHAYRVLLQLEEIVDTHDLQFPLKKAPEIMKIKVGELTQDRVMSMISNKYDEVMEKLNNSDLPKEPYIDNIRNRVLNYYL